MEGWLLKLEVFSNIYEPINKNLTHLWGDLSMYLYRILEGLTFNQLNMSSVIGGLTRKEWMIKSFGGSDSGQWVQVKKLFK
jgi:hypothetical protein